MDTDLQMKIGYPKIPFLFCPVKPSSSLCLCTESPLLQGDCDPSCSDQSHLILVKNKVAPPSFYFHVASINHVLSPGAQGYRWYQVSPEPFPPQASGFHFQLPMTVVLHNRSISKVDTHQGLCLPSIGSGLPGDRGGGWREQTLFINTQEDSKQGNVRQGWDSFLCSITDVSQRRSTGA